MDGGNASATGCNCAAVTVVRAPRYFQRIQFSPTMFSRRFSSPAILSVLRFTRGNPLLLPGDKAEVGALKASRRYR